MPRGGDAIPNGWGTQRSGLPVQGRHWLRRATTQDRLPRRGVGRPSGRNRGPWPKEPSGQKLFPLLPLPLSSLIYENELTDCWIRRLSVRKEATEFLRDGSGICITRTHN